MGKAAKAEPNSQIFEITKLQEECVVEVRKARVRIFQPSTKKIW
jgi:hypothetical protein